MNRVIDTTPAAELEIAARYYARQTWKPHDQPFDPGLAARGAQIHELKCDKCHSALGSEPLDDLPLLKGQWRPYLERQMATFDDGSRLMSEKMEKKYKTLSDDDKRTLLELYASSGK